MERTMSVEERIKRAEEIYNKRRSNSREEKITRVSINKKKDVKLFKKIVLQIIVCLSIYSLFYAILNNDYVFSQDFRNKAQEILSYDIDFKSIYNIAIEKYNNIFNKNDTEDKNEESGENEEVKIQENQDNQEEQGEETTDNNSVESTDTQSEENIGGSNQEEIEINNEGNVQGNTSTEEISQTDQDINYIKSTISFIKPVEGTVSSKFGYRESASEGIPKNHTGTDIAASKGTTIVSATDGKVILASSTGDYRESFKNTNKWCNNSLCTL